MAEKNKTSPEWVRVTLRMTPRQQDLLRRAAAVAGMPVPDFVLRAACQAAEQWLLYQQPRVSSSDVDALPVFTEPARRRWESIPAHMRQRLLANVWCGHCGHEVTITGISGTMKGRDLLLAGRCAGCRGEVARLIEGA